MLLTAAAACSLYKWYQIVQSTTCGSTFFHFFVHCLNKGYEDIYDGAFCENSKRLKAKGS